MTVDRERGNALTRWNKRRLIWEEGGPRRRAWSALDDARLLALTLLGVNDAAAGIIVGGRSRAATSERRRALCSIYGIKRLRPRWREWATSRLDELRRDGMSISEAARALGKTRDAVAGKLFRERKKAARAGALA